MMMATTKRTPRKSREAVRRWAAPPRVAARLENKIMSSCYLLLKRLALNAKEYGIVEHPALSAVTKEHSVDSIYDLLPALFKPLFIRGLHLDFSSVLSHIVGVAQSLSGSGIRTSIDRTQFHRPSVLRTFCEMLRTL